MLFSLNKRLVFSVTTLIVSFFPIIELVLNSKGISTCGAESIGCAIVSLATPYGSLPFLVLGFGGGVLIFFTHILKTEKLLLTLLVATCAFEGTLIAYQIQLGHFCQFCIIFGIGIFILLFIYIWAYTKENILLFSATFFSSFLSIFLLFYPFSMTNLENSWLIEEKLGDSNDEAIFYLLYSSNCGYCDALMDILNHNAFKLEGTFRLVSIDRDPGLAEATKQSAKTNCFAKALASHETGPIMPSKETIKVLENARRYAAMYNLHSTPTLVVVDKPAWTTTISGTSDILLYLEIRNGVSFDIDFLNPNTELSSNH